jgi:transposase-like protein
VSEGSQTEVGVRGVLVRGVLAAMPEVCVDCDNAKSEAEAKSAATAAGKDGLNLGDCQEVYKRWANCIEENNGQAKACKSVMDEFKACHRSQSVVSLDITPRAARHGQQRQR